ncbi:alpha/beta-hydrolase [Aspergillus pseudoustus]|uniref:Alpha/beta-hydrolase n=1 Tax=Aspergillus pseudoustus TaxID=1810923 RepID=A0ABR4J2F2_9EURO
MLNLLLHLFMHPLRALHLSYTFVAQVILILLGRIILPHYPAYQSLRLKLQRAYLSSAVLTFPNLPHRLPIRHMPEHRAHKINEIPAYLVPGSSHLSSFRGQSPSVQRCVVLFAHGGGYARGEARMYVTYMERWINIAAQHRLDLAFVTVEYQLSTEEGHPAQMNAMVKSYQYLLDTGIRPQTIVFMGDSAGGGLSVLAAIELKRLGLPQPAASVLISPWMDMTLSAWEGGNLAVETDYFVSANEAVPGLAALFIRNHAPNSRDVNPLTQRSEDLTDLNPQLIFVGAAEFALYDSKQWASLCWAAGVKCSLNVEWGQLHVYALGSKWTSPAVRTKTDNMIINWMKDHVN